MNHEVKLNYTKNSRDKLVFLPSNPSLEVNVDDTISFTLGNAPTNGVFRLEFESNRDKFSSDGGKIQQTGLVESGDREIRVAGKAAPGQKIKVHYSCKLFVNGKEQANDGGAGDVVIGDGFDG